MSDIEIIIKLIESGNTSDVTNLITNYPLFKNGDNLLLHLCRYNRLEDIKLMLPYIHSEEFINYKNVQKEGVSVLFLCVDALNSQLLETVLSLDGIDTRLEYKNNTILYYTLQTLFRHDTSELCDILIKNPRIDITKNKSIPFLIYMIMLDNFSGHIKDETKLNIIKSVRKRDINYLLEVDNQGLTILHCSVIRNSIQLVTYLVEDIIIPAKEKQFARFTILEPEKHIDLSNVADNEGNLPFHMITSRPIYDILLPKTKDINVMNRYGETLLFIAILHRHSSIIDILLHNEQSYTTTPMIKNKKGTLYHNIFAFSIEDFSFSKLNIPLFRANFHLFVNEQNELGQIPFMMAKEYTNETIKDIDRISNELFVNYTLCDNEGNNLFMFLANKGLFDHLEPYIQNVLTKDASVEHLLLNTVNVSNNTLLMILVGINLRFYYNLVYYLYIQTPDKLLTLVNTDGNTLLILLLFENANYGKNIVLSLFNKYVKLGLINHKNKKGNTVFHYICERYDKSPLYQTLAELCFRLHQRDILHIDIINNVGYQALDLTSDKDLKHLFGYSTYLGIDRIKQVDRLTYESVPVIKPTISDSFTVISWNMYSGKCSNKKEIVDILPYSDVIATQENKSHILPFDSITHGFGFEQVGLYSAHVMSNSISLSSETRQAELHLRDIPIRYALITSIQGITIGNIHMEGGGFTDLKLIQRVDPNLLIYKLSLLENLIEHNPDMIVGDFNSPYSENSRLQEIFEQRQLAYFKSLSPSELTPEQITLIYEWIRAPFRLLKEHGYIYAEPRNTQDITSHKGNIIVDFIWYKPDKIESCVDSYILPLPYDDKSNFCISDHNPVIASFKLRTRASQELPSTFTDKFSPSVECNGKTNAISADIKTRLEHSPVVQAFHVTTEENALLIWNSGTLLCGKSGTYGPGIYCCPRPLDCIYKAAFRDDGLKFTILIEVELYMGNSFVSSSDFGAIELNEYDSVIFKRKTGLEFVVYRPTQVRIRKMYRIYLRNITELVTSYKQTRSESFLAMNNYVLGGWYFTDKQISTFHELGPYHIVNIVDRVRDCPDGRLCTDASISHNLLFNHDRVFDNNKDITSFVGTSRTYLKKSRCKKIIKKSRCKKTIKKSRCKKTIKK